MKIKLYDIILKLMLGSKVLDEKPNIPCHDHCHDFCHEYGQD